MDIFRKPLLSNCRGTQNLRCCLRLLWKQRKLSHRDIDTDKERTFVEDKLLSLYDEEEMFWVGVSYRVCSVNFKYKQSRELVPSGFWAEGQPRGGGLGCVGMMRPNGDLRLYDDLCCMGYFLCVKNRKLKRDMNSVTHYENLQYIQRFFEL